MFNLLSILFILGLFCSLYSYSQNLKLADSLIKAYHSNEFREDKINLLVRIIEEDTNPERRIEYANVLINKTISDTLYSTQLNSAYLQKGGAFRDLGDFTPALETFFKGLDNAQKTNDISSVGGFYIAIGDTYSEIGNSDNANTYYKQGITVIRKLSDSIMLATALLNVGDHNLETNNFDTALPLFEESGLIFEKLKHEIGSAYNKGNMGLVYAEQGNTVLAEKNINEAITILEESEDYYAISEFLNYMSGIYQSQGKWFAAKSYTFRSLDLAKKYGLKEQITDAYLHLSEIHEQLGDSDRSYFYYKNYIKFRDSVKNLKSIEEIADLRTNYEVSQKQIEVNLLERNAEISQLKEKRQKTIIYVSVIVAMLIFLIALGLYRRYHFIKKTNIVIEEERKKSDKLLLNILPEETAQELKSTGKVKAKKFESVTVLFSDFVGFTHYAENLDPEILVKTVDFYFSKFDEIIERNGLEKIKTVGDAYMCAGGLPDITTDHAIKMVQAAFEIIEFVNTAKRNTKDDEIRFDIRVGINTGPLVAGVVGTNKFAYDIWGDSVNIASRMESNSEPGRINISEFTYEIVKNEYRCEFRGEIEVKNRGFMKMYFVNGLKKQHV